MAAGFMEVPEIECVVFNLPVGLKAVGFVERLEFEAKNNVPPANRTASNRLGRRGMPKTPKPLYKYNLTFKEIKINKIH